MSLDTPTLDRVLALPESDRAELARKLLLSLEPPDFDENAEQLWASEIEKRLDAVDRGESVPVDWRPAMGRIRKSLKPRKQ